MKQYRFSYVYFLPLFFIPLLFSSSYGFAAIASDNSTCNITSIGALADCP